MVRAYPRRRRALCPEVTWCRRRFSAGRWGAHHGRSGTAAFRPPRLDPYQSTPRALAEQLLDVLPHPLYSLVAVLESFGDATALEIHRRAFEMVPCIPLGTFQIRTAYRSNLTGYVPAPLPILWSIDKQ